VIIIGLVACQDICTFSIIFCSTIVGVIIGRRVLKDLVPGCGCNATGTKKFLYLVQVIGGAFGEKLLLFTCGKSVETHILEAPILIVPAEALHQRLGKGYPAPDRGIHLFHQLGSRESVLKSLPGVLQNILGDIPQVEVQLSAAVIGHLSKGIHDPEFYELHIGLLKVGGINLPHDSSPAIFRIQQVSFFSDPLRIIVIGTSLLRVIGHIKHRYPCGYSIGIFLIGEDILLVHLVEIGT